MDPLLGKSVLAAMDCALQNFASFQQSVELDMEWRLKRPLPSGLSRPLVLSFPVPCPFLAVVRICCCFLSQFVSAGNVLILVLNWRNLWILDKSGFGALEETFWSWQHCGNKLSWPFPVSIPGNGCPLSCGTAGVKRAAAWGLACSSSCSCSVVLPAAGASRGCRVMHVSRASV